MSRLPVWLCVTLCLLSSSAVQAQPMPAGGHAAGQRPGVANPPRPGLPKSATPGTPAAAGNRTAPRSPARPGVSEDKMEPVDREKLPESYLPPRPTLPEVTLEKEWDYNPFPERQRNGQLSKYRELLRRGEFSPGDDTRKAEEKLLRDVVRMKLAAFTKKENRDNIPDLRQKFLTDLKFTGPRPETKREVRQEMLKLILADVEELMKYQLVVRINGVILLTELNEFEPDGNSGAPAVAYVDAYPLLSKILDDETQPDAVRVWAASGLTRILNVSELKALVRYKIVEVLVRNAERSRKYSLWLQYRLTEALGSTQVLENQERNLVVAQTLAKTLVDTERPLIVRVEAAYGFSRLPLTDKIDMRQLAVEVARLTSEVATAYRKEKPSALWNVTMMKLYATFKPVDEPELKKNWGLLTQVASSKFNAVRPEVTEAFNVVLPVVRSVVGKPNDKALVAATAALDEWLKKYPPTEKSFVSGMGPIREKAATTGGPAGKPMGG